MTTRRQSDYTCAMQILCKQMLRGWLPLLCGLLASGSAQADWLLLQRVTDATGAARPAYTWVGSDRLRYDDGRITVIANSNNATLSVYDHDQRTVMQSGLPRPTLPAESTFTPESTGQFRSWGVSRYLLRKQALLIEVASTLEAPPGMIAPYKLMMTAIGAGSDTRAYSLPGIPLAITVRDVQSGAMLNRRETLSIVQRAPHPATYRVPAGYRSIDAD